MQKMRSIVSFLAVAVSAAACVSSLNAKLVPGADLASVDRVYVVQTEDNDPTMGPVIAEQLESMGFVASSGPREDMPETADTFVTFTDRWMWDVTMYLMQLTITLSEARTDVPLASGESMRSSFARESPPEMAREVLDEIFGAKRSDG